MRAARLEAMGGMYTAPGYTTEFIHLYYATDLSESVLPHDDDEFIEVERVPLAQALAMIDSGEIADGKSIAGLLQGRAAVGGVSAKASTPSPSRMGSGR